MRTPWVLSTGYFAKLFLINLNTGERQQIELPSDVQADNPIVWASL